MKKAYILAVLFLVLLTAAAASAWKQAGGLSHGFEWLSRQGGAKTELSLDNPGLRW